MRVIAACVVALGLIALPAMAGAGATGNAAAAGSAETASVPVAAPAASSEPAAKPAPSSADLENELQQLRDLVDAQSKQIQAQSEQLKAQQTMTDGLVHQLTTGSRDTLAASSSSVAPTAEVAASMPAPSPVVANTALSGTATTAAAGKSAAQSADEPASIRFKGITLTPGGFMAAETVWRQKALASDVNTPFNSAPFNGSSNSTMSEFQASGRQSRIAMLAEGKLASVKIGGYYEMDFLSAGTTSNNNQSNSYTMRQRQFWGQAAFNNGISVTGGQMWSLITETGHGMDNRTEALPQTIDAQYMVGFSWARQFGVRVVKNFNNKFWIGASVEEAQATLTVHGNATAVSGGTAVCITTACTGTGVSTVNTVTNNNFLIGAFGTSGGLYNPLGNYAYNPSPDVIVKAVWEPGFGHYEVFGIFSDFRDRIFPCVPLTGTAAPAGCSSITSAAGAHNASVGGGGIGANARWALLAKRVDIGVHFLGGAGIGRYGSGGLSDLTTHPDGSLVPIHNFQSLGTLQFHPTPKLDINLNVGVEFEERTAYAKSGATPNVGYGYPGLVNSGCWTETLPIAAPGTGNNLGTPTGVAGATGFIPGTLSNCTGDTRNLVEGSIGFWYRFYKGSKGTIQWGAQYANYIRNTWSGVGGAAGTPSASGQPHSDENMVFTSFRYYLP